MELKGSYPSLCTRVHPYTSRIRSMELKEVYRTCHLSQPPCKNPFNGIERCGRLRALGLSRRRRGIRSMELKAVL